MIRPEDIAEAVRFLLTTSRNCLVPEIVFTRPGESL
jgi:NADP-dependent 3-hydroxy acid dehydrogenase YdfG